MFTGPLERLRALLPHIDSDTFNAALFSEAGVFVVRKIIPESILNSAIEAWNHFYNESLVDRKINRFNPVAVQETLPSELESLYENRNVIAIAKQIYGENVALYSFRFVIKDKFSRDPVFVHNDVGYHSGLGINASFFIPLSEVSLKNGAMSFYPGTHHFGYLGDVGELNAENLQPGWPRFTPSLLPGDLVVMNSATWHASAPHTSGPDRIMADVILKSADDPFYKKIISGEAQTQYKVSGSGDVFNRSRVSRLIEYQAQLDGLRATDT